MVKVIQILLLIWFVVINAFILIPSYQVLQQSQNNEALVIPKPPEVPVAPKPLLEVFDPNLNLEEQVKAYTQQISGYTQQVNAYKAYMDNAYKVYGEAANKSHGLEVYKTVVKDSLISLLSTLLSALVGFAFVKAGAELVRNYIAAKNGQPVSQIKLW